MSDVTKTPREELDCKKKYLYEYSMFWECNDGSKSQILEDDVVDLLNELEAKCYKLEKENDELKQEVKQYWAYRDIRKQKIKDLEKQLNFLQNLITDAIQHQKTELGQKVLKEIIRDYNEFLLGHKGVE